MDPLFLQSILIDLAIVLVALTVHEAAHAWTAEKLGDFTARRLGRVSLNPLVHIDPVGTIVLPLVAAYSNLPILGWAKPVPVNVNNLRNGRRDFMLVAAAGPISNILQAVAGAVVCHTLVASAGGYASDTAVFIAKFVSINLLLAFFNLIPVPPLDGGNVLSGLMPASAEPIFHMLRQYGFIVLYALMFTGVLSAVIQPPWVFSLRALLPVQVLYRLFN